MDSPLALYIHIPFCETKCPYCDFNTYAGIENLIPSYVTALENDLRQWGERLGKPQVGSVFWGGGTPSYLPTKDVARLMRAIDASFGISQETEITIESNPGDCSRDRLHSFRTSGFNRISIGVQSLDNNELQLLGRRHDAEGAIHAFHSARAAGFQNINLDLMFGLPQQFVSFWEQTVKEIIELGSEHISAYSLTLEPNTPMEIEVRRGRIHDPDPDIAAEMYGIGQKMFASAGFEQYEISNWAQPGFQSIHNLAYWHSTPYLGIGPGAHSYLHGPLVPDIGNFGVRFSMLRSPRAYIQAIKESRSLGRIDGKFLDQLPSIEECSELERRTAMGEAMMMGLRLNNGVSNTDFKKRFGESINEAFPMATVDCIELDLLRWEHDYLELTEFGRLLGNEAFGRFIAESSS